MRIFGREPALWLTLIATAIRMISAFWINLSPTQQATLNAFAAGTVGLLVAALVRDGINAAILGFVQAMLALAIGFGLHMTPENQALVMSFVATGVAMFVRTQVKAPVTSAAVASNPA